MTQHVAAAAGADGIDVDATSAVGTWLAARYGADPGSEHQLPVRTIWVLPDGLRSSRVRRLVEAIDEHQPDQPPRIVVMFPVIGSLRELVRLFESVRTSSNGRATAIGLTSSLLKGGRPHLVQLGAIRRFAEEWDIEIALDLAGRFDPTWEAEAAVARLGHRLSVIRLLASAPSRGAIGRDRVACRALHAALDREDSLEISVATARAIPIPVTPRSAAAAAAQASSYISERMALHTQALREGIDRFEGSPSSRGF
ncbi:MAG: hypothetical protein U0031_07630 [Thermomicrobiales bacterium]